MKFFCLLLFIIAAGLVNAQTDELKLERALHDPAITSFKKISRPGAQVLQYELLIKQPVDHLHPSGKGFFNQHIILTHRGFYKTTVMETQGYELYPGYNEIEELFDANNLNIEYRFFGNSIPDPVQWEFLTEAQATADLHAINQLFRRIYSGKWISTGISKGGSTTIYYKYFYPTDVDLAVPYVAPLDNALEDKRIYHFFDTIGTAACRNRIFQFQIFLLQHEDEAIQLIMHDTVNAGSHYDYAGSIGKAFELSVLEYSFSFWQYNDDCNSIPINNSVSDHVTALMGTSSIASFSDEGLKHFEAHYYQAATECGYYGYNIEPFKPYIRYFTSNPLCIFPPRGIKIKPFDSTLNQHVQEWLAQRGNNIIYIYGGNDTWSAAGIIPSPVVNAKRFTIPGANHSSAGFSNMSSAMKKNFIATAKTMLDGTSILYW